MSRLLVRRPSPLLAEGEITHIERAPVDAELAQRQWQQYVDVFRARGWQIIEVDPADEHPDGVFVEDAVVMFDDLAVLTSPGAPSRRGELDTVAAALAQTGLDVEHIAEPAHLDGGDVLKIGRTAYVGLGTRTNSEGVLALRHLLEPRGWEVVPIVVSRVLHLKSGVTALPDGTVIGYEPLVDAPSDFPTFLAVPEPEGVAVVVLDSATVLLSASAPRTAELLRARGLVVITTPVTEFEKLEGCVTCLSVRLRDDDAGTEARPTGYTWANRGVDIEKDGLLWYEQLGAVAFASGGASTQTFDEFLADGPPMDGVPDDVVAALRAALESR